jgi:AP-4 complex subunit mu-1
MKSYLSGNPPIKLALNEDLTVGKTGSSSTGVVIDDCNFHEAVNATEFDLNKSLKILPPEG